MDPHQRHLARGGQIWCPFCEQRVAPPGRLDRCYSGEALGGRCVCGAVYVVDETGKSGGLALLDCMTLACDGDLDRAMALRSGDDYTVETQPFRADRSRQAQPHGRGYHGSQIWFLKLRSS